MEQHQPLQPSQPQQTASRIAFGLPYYRVTTTHSPLPTNSSLTVHPPPLPLVTPSSPLPTPTRHILSSRLPVPSPSSILDILPVELLYHIATYLASLAPLLPLHTLSPSITALFHFSRTQSLLAAHAITTALRHNRDVLRHIDACFLLSLYDPRTSFRTNGWLPTCPNPTSFLTLAFRISQEMGQPRWDAATAARVETILSAPREGFGSPNFAVLKALFYQTVAAERRENETQGQQRLVYRCIHRDLVADEGAARRLGMEVYDSYTPGVGSEGGASELLGRFKQAIETDAVDSALMEMWDSAMPSTAGIGRLEGGFAVVRSLEGVDLREFVFEKAHARGGVAGVLQCAVEREGNGWGGFTYTGEVQLSDTLRVTVLKARRWGLRKLKVFAVKGEGGEEEHVGTIKSNLLGTNYSFFDARKTTLGTARFECSFMGGRPRIMAVKIAGLRLTNRKPWWNPGLGAFVLNFSGRVTQPSVKNFQLIEVAAEDENEPPASQAFSKVLLQFGKTGRNSFTMDLRQPMTPLEGFCVSVAALERKVQCVANLFQD